MEGPAAVPGDQAFDLVFPGSGAGFEPAARGAVRTAFCLWLGGDAFGAGQVRGQELSGSVQGGCGFVQDGSKAWKTCGTGG